MKKVHLFAHDISSIPGVTGALEVFNIANILWNIRSPGTGPLFECSVVALEKMSQELCGGLKFEFCKEIHPYEQADVIVATGFLYENIAHLKEKIEQSKLAVPWLRRQYEQGAIIGAACSGTVLLAETKLLDGKTATTSWWLGNLFRTRYPNVKLQINRLLVENGRLLTAGAMTSYLNLVLYLIEKMVDKSLALSCSKMMLIDINRYSQAPYTMLQTILNQSDNLIEKAHYWINEHHQKKFDMHELTDYLAVSYRTLVRRFKKATGDTPTRYLQKVRIEASKRLLETTDLNLETIMERVGYSDPSSFSTLFKRLTQLTPKEYRRQFSIDHNAGVVINRSKRIPILPETTTLTINNEN